jgi:hypothetical protein
MVQTARQSAGKRAVAACNFLHTQGIYWFALGDATQQPTPWARSPAVALHNKPAANTLLPMR